MAAFNFPNSPSVNDTYTANGSTYTWNGTKWVRTSPSLGAQGATGSTGAQGAAGAQGATAAQGAQGATGASGSATLSNNADNRVITGGSGTNLNGEANLTYNGTTLQVQSSGSGLKELLRLKNSNASAGVSGVFFNSTTSGTAFDAACVRNGVNGSGQGRLFLQTNNGSGLVTNLEVEYDGQVSIPTNSLNINDSIVHIGDTDTKIRFPGNDAISFETDGDQRLRIYDDGYVIIGSTSKSSTTGAGGLDIQGNSTNCILEMGNPFPNFSGGIVPEFRITATNSSHTVDFESVWGGDNGLHKHLAFSGGSTIFYKGTNNDEVARFNSSNFGINQSSPATLLHVSKSYSAPTGGFDSNIVAAFTNSGTDSYAGLAIQGGSGAGSFIHFGDTDDSNIGIINYEHSNNSFNFTVNTDLRLKITHADATLYGTTDGVLNITTTDARGSFIRFQESGTTKVWVGSGQGLGLGAATDLGLRATNDIRFRSGAEEHAVLTAEGFFAAKGLAGNWASSNTHPASSQFHQFIQTGNGKRIVVFRQEHHAGLGVNIEMTSTGNSEALYITGNGVTRFRVLSSGNVGNTNNSYGSLSDVSLKENIVDANSQWDDIKAVKVRNFNLKDDTDKVKMLGVVAQELETVSPNLVWEDREGLKGVSYSVLYMKAMKCLQEAQARIETLEAKVSALEGS